MSASQAKRNVKASRGDEDDHDRAEQEQIPGPGAVPPDPSLRCRPS